MKYATLSWPSNNKRIELDNIIFESGINPFDVITHIKGEPVTDFVGRKEELDFFREKLNHVFKYQISRAVRLEGPAGVGKSTLFNYLKEMIESERVEDNPKSAYILNESDIISTYFINTDKIVDFSDIWKPMLEGLKPGLEAETGADISLPEYVALHIVYRTFLTDRENIANIIWTDSNKPRNLLQVQMKDIIDPILDGAFETIKRLQEYFWEHKREIRNNLAVKINNRNFELSRSDNRKIQELLRVLNENDDLLDSVLGGSSEIFNGDDDFINYFNDLMRYLTCATQKQPLLLIGIDEVAKTTPDIQDIYYNNLANLFIKLRNKLSYILFVLISTTEDWNDFDSTLREGSDKRNQLKAFMETLSLKQLNTDELILVFKNRMDSKFWKNYSSHRHAPTPYYPFSDRTFEYIYRFHGRDLRDSIRFLRTTWSNFRRNRNIPKMETIFESLRVVRALADEPLDPNNIKRFETKIIREEFNKAERFNTNAKKSSAIEKGIENAFQCLTYEEPATITSVKNNPTIKTNNGSLRPDVLIEINGNLGSEYKRSVEFQVKAYSADSSVDLAHIKSSLSLFEKGYTDAIFFIITGRGFSANAEARIRNIEATYKSRIRRPSLNSNQIDSLYFLSLYEEIYGKKLGDNGKEDIPIANSWINKLLGMSIKSFLHEIKQLPYREIQGEFILQKNEIVKNIKKTDIMGAIGTFVYPKVNVEPRVRNISTEPKIRNNAPETKNIEVITNNFEVHEAIDPNWLKIYPGILPFKLEASALLKYLQSREGKRYEGKFTIATVQKNIIQMNAGLSVDSFKRLVNILQRDNKLKKVKTSYELTNEGFKFYKEAKKENFCCE